MFTNFCIVDLIRFGINKIKLFSFPQTTFPAVFGATRRSERPPPVSRLKFKSLSVVQLSPGSPAGVPRVRRHFARRDSPSWIPVTSEAVPFLSRIADIPVFLARAVQCVCHEDDHEYSAGVPTGRAQEENAPDQGGNGAVQGRVRGDHQETTARDYEERGGTRFTFLLPFPAEVAVGFREKRGGKKIFLLEVRVRCPLDIDFDGDVIVLGDFKPLYKQKGSHAAVITENWTTVSYRSTETNPNLIIFFFFYPIALKRH